MMYKDFKLPSTNGKDSLHVYVWEPEGEIKAILQISHGMVEYLDRYSDFAEYLRANGILVIGNDHLGHGRTAKEEDLGYFGTKQSETVVDDLYEVTKYAKKTYGDNVAYFLLGHSMGSFMARRYIMTYGNELTGVIISGTGSQPALALKSGLLLAGIIKAVKGERHAPDILFKIAFSAYNKRIKNPATENDWLTRDAEIVKKYNADPWCTFKFSADGYQTLFGAIDFIQKKANIEKIPKDLPIYIVSGEEDPVGNYGKGVVTVYKAFKDAGIKDVSMTLYKDDRHEILNELDKDVAYKDILDFVKKHM